MTDPRQAGERYAKEASVERRGPARIRMLGGFSVSVGSRRVERDGWRRRKAASLVKLLALASNHRLHRDRVMDLLWPEFEKGAAANNLYRTLYIARRILEPTLGDGSRYLQLSDEYLTLCPFEPLWVDVEGFEEAAASARRLREPAAYRAAIELYAGELLPEDRYEEWAEMRREELRQSYLALLVEAAMLYQERAEYGMAADSYGEVIANEPTHEEAHTGLMRLFALGGQGRRAMDQYERLRRAMRTRLDSEPGAGSRRLYEEISTGRFSPTPAPTGTHLPEQRGVTGSHNLPAARTSFVDRDGRTLEVKRLLSMTRLLTFTGPGGCGKTRLALEVSRDLVGTYPDGVWLVELASLSDGTSALRAVGATVGAREQPGEPLITTLADHLRTKAALLILDNCEHLIKTCARLADALLDTCAGLRILATSREPLNVAGEVVWQVPRLRLPDPEQALSVEGLERCESMRLFVERVHYRPSSFVPTPRSARAVARICQDLDGIPLAIELAAARAGALAVEQISERLGDSLKLLTVGDRTAAPRQQTLRGALDWSHGLLSKREKSLFERLPVFVGGWTLQAAEEVCAGEEIEVEEVLDLLSRLVNKSLVETATDPGSEEARYRLLETVRQYGLERLEASGAAPGTRRRHATYFLELAERAELELTGARQETWLDRLDTEYDNLRTALSRAAEANDSETGLRLAGALWRFCYTRGHYGEGREWLERALAGSEGAPMNLRAKALTGAGVLTFLQCDYERAAALIGEGLNAYRHLADRAGEASALQTLGSIARERGRYAEAVALHEKSLELQRELGDEEGVARSLDGLGMVAWLQREHDRADELCSEALALYKRLQDTEGMAWSLVNLGATALHGGDLGKAQESLVESLSLSRRSGYREGVAWSLNQLGVVEQRRGEHGRAATLLSESLEVHRDLGDRWRSASVMEAMACSATERGLSDKSARLIGAAAALREAIGAPLPPCERPDHDRTVSALRARMGEKPMVEALEKGRTLGFKQAVEYALAQGPIPASREEETSSDRLPSVLTRREHEVAVLVARGLTNRRIADELTLSEHTVTAHVRAIRKKLGFHTRAEIAVWITQRRSG